MYFLAIFPLMQSMFQRCNLWKKTEKKLQTSETSCKWLSNVKTVTLKIA